MRAGHYKPGSPSAKIHAALAAGPQTRKALARLLDERQRPALTRTLRAMILQDVARETSAGFEIAGPARRDPPIVEIEALAPTPEPLRLRLGAITRRAHALARAGQRAPAVLLLSTASRHPALPAHVAAGMACLAALFRHHDAGWAADARAGA